MNKIEHEGIGGTCARIEESKIVSVSEVHKTYKLCGRHIFNFLFFLNFFSFTFYNIFYFHPQENES